MMNKSSNRNINSANNEGNLNHTLRKIFWISNFLIDAIAILDLIGWISGITFLKSASPYWEPMKIITAICFLVTSLSLSTVMIIRSDLLKKTICVASAVFLSMVSLLTLFSWTFYDITGHQSAVTNTPVLYLFLGHGNRMAIFTAINFFLIAMVLISLVSKKSFADDLAHVLNFPVGVIAFIILTSYLLNVYSFRELFEVPVALNTGIAFCAVFVAILMLRPDSWLMKVLISRDTGGIMSRRLLPGIIVLPVFVAWLEIQAEHSKMFSSEIGTLLVGVTFTTCLVLLVWLTARSINIIDAKKNSADEALKKSYEDLETRIRERTSELFQINKALESENKERIRAEAMVERERQRINGLLENLPAYIILLTTDYQVSYSNRFFRERFGVSHGKRCYEFLFDRTEACEVCETYKTLKENRPQKWDWTGPDGRVYSIHDFPYADIDGSPLILEMGIDVTELKQAESSMIKLNAELEERVKERTSELLRVNERLDILSQTSGKLLVSKNPQQLINSLCSRVMEFLDCRIFVNYLIDEEKGRLHLNSYEGFSEKTAHEIEWLEYGQAVCGCVARDGLRIVAEDIFNTQDSRTNLVRSMGITAYACHPLVSYEKVIGTLSFGSSSRIRFSDDDLLMMKTVADQVSIAITRVKDEDSMRKSEERYRMLLENSPSATIVNKNDSIEMINPAAMRLLGISNINDVLGTSPMKFFHPDYHRRIASRMGMILKGKDIPVVEEKIVRPNGEIRDIEVVSVATVDSEGPSFQFIMNDITERKLAEKELFDTKNYLQNLIDNANAPIIVWDRENRIRVFNHAFEHLTGYSSSEIEGKSLSILFPKDTLKESMTKIKQALTENWKTIEIPILTKNNNIRIALWNSAKVYDKGRKTYSIIAQGNDITERIEAERAFRESKEKLELALENGKIGTWEWDFSSDSFSLDNRMEKMLGIKSGEFENTLSGFEKRIHEEDLQHLRNAMSKALNEDKPLDTVFRVKHENYEVNYVSTKALVEKDNAGNPVKMSGVCFDITEMKLGAEKALFFLNEELLRSNKELEQFAYVASHDLQEPLRMISSFTQLLAQRYNDRLDSDARDFIQYAVDGAARMQVLINDLLAYSRVQTRGKQFSVVDMHNVLGQVMSNLRLMNQESNALVTNDELPEVFADEGQMVQLMQNLIGNGLKFCKTAPRIHISVTEEKEYYVFSVKDNGIGIEKQYYEKIFQIFQRLHTKDKYGGTGIGLAICNRIVTRHGGKIWVDSKYGKGSVFYFTILKRQTT